MSESTSGHGKLEKLELMAVVAGWLVCAMPVLFILGKAPPDIALSLVALMFLVRSAVARDWSWLRIPWVAFALCLWLYLLLVSFLFADHTALALERTAPWFRFLVFAAALQWWVLSRHLWRRRLMLMTGAVLAFVAADMIFQFFNGADIFGFPIYNGNRLTGPMPELPPKVGMFVTRLMFPVLVALLFWGVVDRRGAWPKIAAIAALCTGVTTVLISGERMALLLALLGLGVTAVLMPVMPRVKWYLAGAIVAVLMSAAGVISLNDTVFQRSFQSTVSTIANFRQSEYGRIWLASFEVAKARPVFGVGVKNFRISCHDIIKGLPNADGLSCGMHPHNFYLEWLSETGTMGLIGFLCLIGLWCRHFKATAQLWRSDANALGLVVAVITFLWPISSTMSFFTNWHAALFWFILGWAMAATSASTQAGIAR